MAILGNRIYLVRHGEARPKSEHSERPLTTRGREITDALGESLYHRAVRVDEIRHSAKLRAEQTAYILAAYLNPIAGVHEVSGLLPNDPVEPVVDIIQNEIKNIMYVGHLPFMGYLAEALLEGEPVHDVIEFPTSGIVCLEYRENGWNFEWRIPE